MLDIFKWGCTINEACLPRAFPFEKLHFIEKKLPLLKNLHLPTKKNRTVPVFMQ